MIRLIEQFLNRILDRAVTYLLSRFKGRIQHKQAEIDYARTAP